jgi:predicted esterase
LGWEGSGWIGWVDGAEERYEAVVDRVEVLYEAGRLREGLDVLASAGGELEPWAAELAHLKACLLGALGDADVALKVLREAAAAGGWWDESILTEDDDLAALRERSEFQELVAVSRQRRTDDPRAPLIAFPSAARDGGVRAAVGVVVALHGAGQRAAHAARDWAGVLELGYALVCVESSRRMSPMYRTWPDREHAAADIARALAEMPGELQGLPLIAAGFSAGGRVAVDWALTAEPVPVTGLIAVAPALRQLPTAAAGSLSPATILIGTDDDLVETIDESASRLSALGCTIRRLPDLGHEFPRDFAALLASTLPVSA